MGYLILLSSNEQVERRKLRKKKKKILKEKNHDNTASTSRMLCVVHFVFSCSIKQVLLCIVVHTYVLSELIGPQARPPSALRRGERTTTTTSSRKFKILVPLILTYHSATGGLPANTTVYSSKSSRAIYFY